MTEKSQDKVPAPTAAEKKAAKEAFDPTDPAQTRSGGPRVADPDAEPEVPVHSPDLADNPPGPPPAPGSIAPIDITHVEEGDDLSETLRNTLKADVLTYWRRQERAAAKPRQGVIDAINTRLREVQGDPISQD